MGRLNAIEKDEGSGEDAAALIFLKVGFFNGALGSRALPSLRIDFKLPNS